MKTIAKWMGLAFVVALFLATLTSRLQAAGAASAVYVVPTGATTAETIACNAGVSPCTIGTTSTTVLNSNANRMQCLLQNANTPDFYCIQGTGTASSTNMHFVLKGASAANKGDGGTFTCNQGPALWRGPIVCVASGAGGTLNASGANAAGY